LKGQLPQLLQVAFFKIPFWNARFLNGFPFAELGVLFAEVFFPLARACFPFPEFGFPFAEVDLIAFFITVFGFLMAAKTEGLHKSSLDIKIAAMQFGFGCMFFCFVWVSICFFSPWTCSNKEKQF
jgi:hypothetical protein